MNEVEIKAQIESIVQLMVSKGMRSPDASFVIHNERDFRTELQWYTDEHDEKPDIFKLEFFYDANIHVCLANANEFVCTYPSIAQRKETSFARSLARTIELGRKQNISIDLNPLEELMKKLSENAIEDHRTPIGKEIDDEIPF